MLAGWLAVSSTCLVFYITLLILFFFSDIFESAQLTDPYKFSCHPNPTQDSTRNEFQVDECEVFFFYFVKNHDMCKVPELVAIELMLLGMADTAPKVSTVKFNFCALKRFAFTFAYNSLFFHLNFYSFNQAHHAIWWTQNITKQYARHLHIQRTM